MSAWPCFLCGADVRNTDGHGSNPWICAKDKEELSVQWARIFGGVTGVEEGVILSWPSVKYLLDHVERNDDRRVLVLEITDKARREWGANG